MTKTEFTFEMDDWMAFQKHFMSNSKQFKNARIVGTYMIPLLFGIILTFQSLSRPGFLPFGLAVYTVLSILWIISYPKRYEKKVLAKTQKVLEEGDNNSFLGSQKIEFNEQCIIHHTKYSEHKIHWEGILKMQETDEYFFFYDTSVSAIIIPKIKIETSAVWELQEIINRFPEKNN